MSCLQMVALRRGRFIVSSTVFLNGEYIPHEKAVIHVEDRGFTFADALYEVFRIYGGKPFTLDRHIQRMERGAEVLRFDYGYSERDFGEIIEELVHRNDLPESFAYVQVSRGVAPRDHLFPAAVNPTILVMLKPVKARSMDERLAGATCITYPDRRYGYCSVKTVALLPNVLARQAAADEGALEAILIRDGLVTEGSNTNVYIVKDGSISTYPVVNILPGITRSVISELCAEDGIPFVEETFTTDSLFGADEVILTGSVMEIMPITHVDRQPIGSGESGPSVRRLIDLYIKRVEQDCGQYYASPTLKG